ncbi:MAG: hypothetical protein QOI11_3519 [Candidatus Eremiobacteraeota bacterium]|jgi:hypothetical protein|nr:hypothetical protein [Candidatus Eremiobacteraeota bacterium]
MSDVQSLSLNQVAYGVARDPTKLDLFMVGDDGDVHTAAWDQDAAAQTWQGWWPIVAGGVPAIPGSSLTAVARDPTKLDVFLVGADGNVYTAAWDRNAQNGEWQGWWPIVAGSVPAIPGSEVFAVARDPMKLDVFVVGADGNVYTAGWDGNAATAGWQGWWAIGASGSVPAVPGTALCAVSRDPQKLDVFLTGADGNVYTAGWDGNAAAAGWQGWWLIPDGGGVPAVPGAMVYAVSRDPAKLDVFLVGYDAVVYAAAWDQNANGSAWAGWWPIAGGSAGFAIPGTPIYAVSRDPTRLDVFVSGADGVYTAAWSQTEDAQNWHGWWAIASSAPAPAVPGGAVFGVTRGPTKLDVFVIGSDAKMYTAAWDQNADQQWHGWWPIAN